MQGLKVPRFKDLKHGNSLILCSSRKKNSIPFSHLPRFPDLPVEHVGQRQNVDVVLGFVLGDGLVDAGGGVHEDAEVAVVALLEDDQIIPLRKAAGQPGKINKKLISL